MFEHEFHTIAALLAVAAVIAAAAVKLRQPLIISFIAVGIVVGPIGLGWVEENNQVALLAELGIALLLFLVGLKLDPHLIRTTGPVAVATGLGQVVFTSVVGFGLGLLLGLSPVEAVYVAVALTFSSTIIIVKLLSDKREIDQLHGRIAVGFLIVQDIVVVLVMIVLTAFGTAGEGDDLAVDMALVLGKGVLFVGGVFVAMRFLLRPALGWMSRSKELLVLFALAWGIALAGLGDWLGFSIEVGAFLGGISLAATPYREAIGSRLISLRDFLLLFFFIDLGSRLDFADAASQLVSAAVLSAFVLIGNPLIVLVIMGLMGYRKRTSFLAGLTVAQISEFSLVLAALGLGLGHITADTVGLITAVGIVTIALSTYMILYSAPLYARLAPLLSVFERSRPTHGEEEGAADPSVDMVVIGAGRYGGRLVRQLLTQEARVLVIDSDPQALENISQDGAETLYGDAEEPELIDALPLRGASWVVSTVPDRSVNLALLHGLDQTDFAGKVALTAHNDHDAERLEAAGVDLVLRPFHAAADSGAALLLDDARPRTGRDGPALG
ncbi:cation:proton antiporter [Blastococcus tunisiensis]|uniref:Predicted Kef-type K+ transport protein, K+/H+ antiporter domain n=1 Tax=Blastococcus tunisiensis TaxID=1798228 RepID=A0A1I2DKB4_9ACTN|nr:cation:proton antiporter [Blastococcus sp. DSM 46838]SFE80741.1 Predicted Kef-type K+ transport protein, K+/H+ antiporter domain [Blastococcus sp. DSM 46838]